MDLIERSTVSMSRIAVGDVVVPWLMRSTSAAVRYGIWAIVLLMPLMAQAQARRAPLSPPETQVRNEPAQPRMEFAAVSIKPVPPGPFRGGFSCHGTDGNAHPFDASFNNPFTAPQGRCVGTGVSPPLLIGVAYGIEPRYVSGGPDWIRGNLDPSKTFTIEATAEDTSAATTEQLRQMLQTMLADRFKLKFHRETHESAGYALALSKGGLKLREASGEDESPFSVRSDKGQPAIKGKSRLDQLAQALSRFVDGPVVDKTGVVRSYDYEFILPNISAQRSGRGAGPDASDISGALEEQLGLRLQAQKVPVEIIVIDQIERPSPN
jgi:uncharacterized protein (TIGR03435 family)